MNYLRENYLTGEYVLMSEARKDRPFSYKKTETTLDGGIEICPFCKENEHMVPYVIYESACGRVKCMPNKYPALQMPKGYHEVIADTNIHNEVFEKFSIENTALVFETLKLRSQSIYESENMKYVQMFKNKGMAAGASVFHSHWQILALSVLPVKIKTIRDQMEKFYEENKISYYEAQYLNKDLLVYENQDFFVHCPYASLFYKELHIAPKKRMSTFQECDNDMMLNMADAVQKALFVYKQEFSNLSYNVCFMDFPKSDQKGCHFYIQLIPRMGSMAGFEFATGAYINSALPEKTAPAMAEIIK